ncbi:hypothetical protein L6452_08388 [Arctium lappa]|uniref:Uncharacterized protein n=1 Tax=Arctium lappa TaxID=4217 RepID=A0ACB9DH29_ARCLA|nr:hypothetical protein L6452_08388 [Arctium lappa]
MESMVMTIYDSLKRPTLEQDLKDMMGEFIKKMPQLFMDLGEGARATAFISTLRSEYALDVPQQAEPLGDYGPWANPTAFSHPQLRRWIGSIRFVSLFRRILQPFPGKSAIEEVD